MSSVLAVVPDSQLTVGVFTNAYFSERHVFESVIFASAVKLRALDYLLSQEPVDWLSEYDSTIGR